MWHNKRLLLSAYQYCKFQIRPSEWLWLNITNLNIQAITRATSPGNQENHYILLFLNVFNPICSPSRSPGPQQPRPSTRDSFQAVNHFHCNVSFTFFSILSHATVSLMMYWRPKNQFSLSPRVLHTSSNKSLPFHFTWKEKRGCIHLQTRQTLHI